MTSSVNLKDALVRIPTEASTSDDRVAWTLDVAALALEHRRRDHARASFEGHERHFRATPGGEAVARALGRVREVRARLNLRAPAADDLDALHRAVLGLVEAAEAGTAPYLRRVSYGVRAVNHVSLETRNGLRSFHLLHGNALAARADVLVVPSHADASRNPEGQLVSALRWRWGMPVHDPGPLLRFPQGGWASWLPDVPAEAPFRGVLLLRSPGLASHPSPLDALGDQLRGAFAALRALSYLGTPVATVTMPMIAGNRLDDVDGRAQVTLQEVSRWLRAEASSEQVQAVVFYSEELLAWDGAMNRVLGRTYVGPGQDAVLDGLHKDVLGRLATCSSLALASSVAALRDELLRADGQLAVHAVCTFARKLVEEMVGDVLRRRGMKVSHELARNIETVRESGIIAPWVASYMHGLRVLGNEAVHERGTQVSYSPRSLGQADLAHALAAVRALLEVWSSSVGETGSPRT